MRKLVTGVVAGIMAYSVIVFASAIAAQAVWPELASIENSRNYTLFALLHRLGGGGFAVFVSGAVAGIVSKRFGFGGLVHGLAIQVLFTAIHIAVWDDFPAWYHLSFLCTLIPLAWAGGGLAGLLARRSRRSGVEPEHVPWS